LFQPRSGEGIFRRYERVNEFEPSVFPSFEAHLSKLGLRKLFRGASRAAETAICGREVSFSKERIPPPRITARRHLSCYVNHFLNLLEARRPNGTGGFSNCCSRQFHRMASDFSSSET